MVSWQLRARRETIGRYTSVLTAIVADSFWRLKGRIISILASHFLGAFLQVNALGLALGYVRLLESKRTLTFMGLVFDPRTSMTLLLAAGFGALTSLLIGARLLYYADAGTIRVGRLYEEFCAQRVLSLLARSRQIWCPHPYKYADTNLVYRIVRGDARYCGRSLRVLIDSVVPAGAAVVSFAVLVYSDILLTVAVVLLMAFSALFLYRVNVGGARASSLMEKHAGPAARAIRVFIQAVETIPSPLAHSYWIGKLFHSGAAKHYLDAYEGRLRAVKASEFISNVLQAVTVFIILLTLGARILREGTGWTQALLYLAALRVAAANFRKLSASITSVNRFYPQLRRYLLFVKHTTPLDGGLDVAATGTPTEPYVITTTGSSLPGSLAEWQLKAGHRVALVTPIKLNRYTLRCLLGCLVGAATDADRVVRSTWFVTARNTWLPKQSVLEYAGLPGDYNPQHLMTHLQAAGLYERFTEQLPGPLHQRVSEEAWQRVDPGLKFALGLLAALYFGWQWVVLEAGGLRSLPNEACRYFLDRLSDRVLVVVYTQQLRGVGGYDEDVVVVSSEDGVIGLGPVDWAMMQEPAIEIALGESAPAGGTRRGELTGMDDDDDLDFD